MPSPAPLDAVETAAVPLPDAIAPLPATVLRPGDLQLAAHAATAAMQSDLPASGALTSAASVASPAPASPPPLAVPRSATLVYDVRGEIKGFPYYVGGQLDWQHDETQYTARMEISHFLLGARVQTSKGALTGGGLEPLRFGDKVRSEVAAHFEREKGKVSFSANTPDVALMPEAQDQLSIFLQMASLIGGDPQRFAPGTEIAFQAIGPRSAERWVFKVGTLEKLTLPGGELAALHLTRDPVNENDPRADAWLAPSLGYLPVRIRLSQANGDFVEQQWKSTKYPP